MPPCSRSPQQVVVREGNDDGPRRASHYRLQLNSALLERLISLCERYARAHANLPAWRLREFPVAAPTGKSSARQHVHNGVLHSLMLNRPLAAAEAGNTPTSKKDAEFAGDGGQPEFFGRNNLKRAFRFGSDAAWLPSRYAYDLGQKPRSSFGLVNPDFNQARARDILVAPAKFVRRAQESCQTSAISSSNSANISCGLTTSSLLSARR